MIPADHENTCDSSVAGSATPSSQDHENLPQVSGRLRAGEQAIRAYFYSGWAFFIPYLLSYLLYAWRAWPANSESGSELGTLTGDSLITATIPALLHVYWVIHAIHLTLAISALIFWWRRPPQAIGTNGSLSRPTGQDGRSDALHRLVPWIMFAALISIPGVYLEWPSDPWEHLRRITEWQTHASVSGHSAGYKSFYFLAYSLVGWMPPGPLLIWINIYYTAICLCLAWQYYLLGKAVGLDAKWATAFVAVGAVTFGNSSFSYYRYYGLATTIFAQIAAVALTRTFLSWVAPQHVPEGESRASISTPQLYRFHPWSWLSRTLSCAFLLALIASSHIQGLGIAALGVAAIGIWRLIEWKRSMATWTVAALALLNVAVVLWWPRHWMIDAAYRQFGWMNAWYGFNILSVGSGAFERTTQILGIAGLVNILAGVWLLRRNEIVGWLTVTPLLALLLPIVAIPFANKLAADSSIIVFHRMFLAIPSGLALIFVAKQLMDVTGRNLTATSNGFPPIRFIASSVGLLYLASIVLLPGSRPSYNRAWHTLSKTPKDLQARNVIAAAGSTIFEPRRNESAVIISSDAVGSMLHDILPHRTPRRDRHQINGGPISDSVEETCSAIRLVDDMRRRNRQSLTDDPLAANPLSWKLLGGTEPDFVEDVQIFHDITTAIQNKPGKRADILTSDLIAINPETQYVVALSVIQRAGPAAVVSPAVVWYDQGGRLLISNVENPLGAGHPAGWINGTYSYFGSSNRDAPRVWTSYYRPFGPRTRAVIPKNARFCRVGAVLNHTGEPEVVQQATNIRLWAEPRQLHAQDVTISDGQLLLVVVPPSRTLVSVRSQGSLHSSHWPGNQVASDLSGSNEITLACKSAGGLPLGDAVFLLSPHSSLPPR